MDHQHHDEKRVEVAVYTTAGRYPATGFDTEQAHQKIALVLNRAARALHISQTDQWVARANGSELDPRSSYADSGLSGQVTIDFGPRESGGG